MSTSPTEVRPELCKSCSGAGEIGTDNGPATCPDCFGEGRQLDSLERTEWRLRDIEGGHVGGEHGCEADVRWLAFELRRAREALVRIVSRSQDADEDDQLARDVRHVAMDALALYHKVPAASK